MLRFFARDGHTVTIPNVQPVYGQLLPRVPFKSSGAEPFEAVEGSFEARRLIKLSMRENAVLSADEETFAATGVPLE